MRRALLCLIAFCSLAAFAADEPWFQLLKARDSGFIGTGKLHGASYLFRIPGTEVKSLAERGSKPIFLVDGVLMTVLAVSPEDYGRDASDPIAAQRKYEQDYQRKTFPGVKFSELEVCAESPLPHGGWVAQLPPRTDTPSNLKDYHGLSYQVFVTYQVSDVVLAIGSAYGDDDDKKKMAAKLDAICRSFMRDKP